MKITKILSLGILFLAISQSAFAAVSTGYYDIDSDAQVETIEIDFSENIDTCTYEASDWTINTAGSIDVTAVTAVTCNANIATLTVTTHVDITGGATDPIITYTNQGNINDMVINGTNLATTNFTAVDKAAPTILYTYIDSTNANGDFAKEGDEVTFSVAYSENVVVTVGTASSANNATTLDEDASANDFNFDLIKFIVANGDNGLITPNNIDYSIDDMAAIPNTSSINSLGVVTESVTADTIAPVITSAAAVDADENQTNAITITASGDPVQFHKTGGNDAGLFSIDIPTGAITFNAAPDFENPTDNGTDNDYDFNVTARDAAGNDSTVQAVVVSVKNVNEAPNIIDYVESKDEDIAIGTQIIIIGDGGNFMDDTDVDGDAIIYSIIAGNTNNDFAIDAANGTLTNVHNLDFETTPNYTLIVQGSDGILTDTGTVTITVNDIAEATGHSGKSHSSVKSAKKVCKDSKATNFDNIGQHDPSLCKYKEEESEGTDKKEKKNGIDFKMISDILKTMGYADENGDGIVDILESLVKQQETSCSVITTGIYRVGSRGEAVRQIQQYLKDNGYLTGTVDGIFGNQTAAAVRKMQTKLGLIIDGIIGSQSIGIMNTCSK